MKRILTIDGGGIRGIIPGVILAYIESKLPSHKLSDYFDMIAGTSTGGILTCCYLYPGNKYSAQDAVDMYISRGQEIFDSSLWYKIKSAGGLNLAKYQATNIEKIFNEYFGELKLSDFTKPCAITTYDITRRKIKIFNSIDAQKSSIDNYFIKDVARATSAAPTYFPPKQISSVYGSVINAIDGGIFANNPTMVAYSEAKEHFGADEKLFLLSIGPGSENKSYDINKATSWGMVGWLRPSIDMLMSSNSECVDYNMTKINTDYIRLSPSLCGASHELDDASDKNLSMLEHAGKLFVAENALLLDDIIKKIIQ